MRAALFFLSLLWSACALASDAPVVAGRPLSFPRDFGSHPEFRTEWWYVTGWLNTPQGETLGFQITFFRTKPGVAANNPSAFAPAQILIAHCAVSDPKLGRLWQDQRIRRAGLTLAGAAEEDTKVWIDEWSLVHEPQAFVANINGADFSLHLKLAETQPALLNGERGFSRKGAHPGAASYYYSLPHLKVEGTLSRQSQLRDVSGEAWFDHEWSSEYLEPEATGWDWMGLNLDDGGALMAFRIRGVQGETRWAGATLRSAQGNQGVYGPGEVEFCARRTWVSLRTGIHYPVEWSVRVGPHQYDLQPLLDDQENDTRLSTGAIYWEGAVRASDAGVQVGRGYLELTGYGTRLQLR